MPASGTKFTGLTLVVSYVQEVRPCDMNKILRDNQPNGGTPMGASLRDKILKPLVLSGRLIKPALVITSTDGESCRLIEAWRGMFGDFVKSRKRTGPGRPSYR